MKGNKTEMYHWTLGEKTAVYDFFSFFEQYQSEYHCYSKCLALFRLETLRLATSAVSDARRPVSLWESGRGRGSVHRCLSAVVLRAPTGSPHSAALPPGLHLTLPSVSQDKAAPPRLANHGSSPHAASPTGACQALDPAVVPALPPHLSVL